MLNEKIAEVKRKIFLIYLKVGVYILSIQELGKFYQSFRSDCWLIFYSWPDKIYIICFISKYTNNITLKNKKNMKRDGFPTWDPQLIRKFQYGITSTETPQLYAFLK